MSVRKANATEEEAIQAMWIYHQCDQSTHMTDGMSVMSLSASLLQNAAMDLLFQVMLK